MSGVGCSWVQVVLPPTGARLMVGSDGVWDAFDKMTKVGAMSRSWPLEVCADRLVQVSRSRSEKGGPCARRLGRVEGFEGRGSGSLCSSYCMVCQMPL